MLDLPVQENPVQVNPVLIQKIPESGEFRAVVIWTATAPMLCKCAPKRSVSRGDRSGVCMIALSWFSYNFLLEGKTYIRIRRAFHWQEPSDARIHVSQ